MKREEKRREKMKDEKRLFLFFLRMFRILPFFFFFSIIFMIRIRFFGLRESFQQEFRDDRVVSRERSFREI